MPATLQCPTRPRLFQRGSDELFSACVTNGPFIMSSSASSAGEPPLGCGRPSQIAPS